MHVSLHKANSGRMHASVAPLSKHTYAQACQMHASTPCDDNAVTLREGSLSHTNTMSCCSLPSLETFSLGSPATGKERRERGREEEE